MAEDSSSPGDEASFDVEPSSSLDPITQASHQTEAAFQQLIKALDAEAQAWSAIGGKAFYRGTLEQSRPILRAAGVIGRVRDHVKYLHTKWESNDVTVMKVLKVQDSEPTSPRTANQPKRFRAIKGMPVRKAAEMLGVKPAMVRTWLDSGLLKGYRRLSGNWKITQIQLVAFSKKHPTLVGRLA